MATVTVETSAVYLTVQNLSSWSIVAMNRKLGPGASADVPRRYINYWRAKDLAELVNKGYISITIDNQVYSLSGYGPLSVEFIQGLAEPTAAPFSGLLTFANADRPGVGGMPDGTMIWNTDTLIPNWADATSGTGWVDATGADV